MLPTLRPGDTVLADPFAYRRRRPQPGDIVLARHPFRTDTPLLIKRIAAVTDDGRYQLQGDNPDSLASSDSRSFGPLPLAALRGRVTAVWH